MIQFSISEQSFYDLDLNYKKLPNDLIEVTSEQHYALLDAINSGCIVFSDLTFSPPKPTQFHTEWNGTAWIDQRTQEEIAVYKRSLLQKLSKRQFSLYLYDNDMYDQVMQAIEENPRFKIEYDTVSEIERLSPTVTEMSNLLDWTDEQVDEMWKQTLKL